MINSFSAPTATTAEIKVHGRGSFVLPWSRWTADPATGGTQIDISSRTIVIEIDGIPITKTFVSDPNDALGLRLILTQTDIAQIPSSPKKFAIIDKTDATLPDVQLSGTIQSFGFLGSPDGQEG